MTGAVEGRLAEAWTKVRSLHKPVTLEPSLVVCGCGDEVVRPWPCKTASLVYGPREVLAALAGTPPEDEATT